MFLFMKKYFFLITFLTTSLNISWSQQAISLEDIFEKGVFRTNTVPGFNFLKDGRHYSRQEGGQIRQYDFTTGDFTKVIFNAAEVQGNTGFPGRFRGYTFSDNEQKVLIQTAVESIYRHSTRANYFWFDRKSGQLSALSSGGKQRYASFNPEADKVAFVRENNLFYKDLQSGKEVQITSDGKYNHIINGSSDWVYEEEFSITKTFEWSPDGKHIAFMRFNESEVPEFSMAMYYDELYPQYYTYKYPKVGQKNAKVTIHIYDVATGKTIKVQTGKAEYFPRIKWTQDPNQLCIYQMNRHQNELELLLADAKTGQTRTLLKETNKYYIEEERFDHLIFLENGKNFIWASEKDGYNHLYLYDMSGKEVRQITQGKFEVTSFYGMDQKKELLYYQAAEVSPMNREIYVIDCKGKNKKRLSPKDGWNTAQFSSTFDYFVNTHATINQAPTYTVRKNNGSQVRVIEDNVGMKQVMETYAFQPVEFFNFTTSEEVSLNGMMIKPPNFDDKKQYPVFMYVYGGPNSQTVKNLYDNARGWWFQMLAQKGYIVVSVDNRGTGARGEEFKKVTYKQLGKYETIDQIEAAKYMAKQPYVDSERIGIYGWSYGGFMSANCILKGNDIFKAAIAVAPITNWKWYDTIYTERFMQTEEENREGYFDNSPIYLADRLKGKFLLMHGIADDNVHFQHTVELANALIKAKKQFDTYFYPNRNHGIYGDNATIHIYTKMTDFILENI